MFILKFPLVDFAIGRSKAAGRKGHDFIQCWNGEIVVVDLGADCGEALLDTKLSELGEHEIAHEKSSRRNAVDHFCRFAVSELGRVCNISCIVQHYVVHCNKNAIFGRAEIRLDII